VAIHCGIDIIEVDRVRKALERRGDSFKKKVFTEKEISYCESKNLPVIKALQPVLQRRKQPLKH